jgi:toxin HigB-1
MIATFKYRDAQALFQGRLVARFVNIEAVAIRKLQQLNAATSLTFLRLPPNNRLEQLKGDRAGQYSIRINDQWRICFGFDEGNAVDVEIVDYY